ncbi:MAG TPA: zinc-binding dehydrogenase [Rubricoccaceae bacterium]|nr:zinc-binding dehydrogenase [Rubricoccaceae bacterium]
MKAVVFDRFGEPDVLQLRDVAEPSPGPGEVLVRVHAAGVNPVDTKVRRYGDRYGLAPPVIPGYDVSGVVEAVGEGVDDLVPGDAVFYTPPLTAHGAYAAYHVAPADLVVVKPEGLSHEEAAAIPLAACTAWQALVDRAGIGPAETVLIHGGGGVGHFAVQIAAAAGAEVVVVGSPAMEDALLGLGADAFVSYEDGDRFVDVARDLTGGLGADVVLDTVGGDTLERSVPALAEHGRMATIVGDAAGAFGKAYQKNGTVHLVFMERDGGMLDRIARLAERGLLRPLVADVLPLAEAAEAHRRLEAGGVHGKLVLTP